MWLKFGWWATDAVDISCYWAIPSIWYRNLVSKAVWVKTCSLPVLPPSSSVAATAALVALGGMRGLQHGHWRGWVRQHRHWHGWSTWGASTLVGFDMSVDVLFNMGIYMVFVDGITGINVGGRRLGWSTRTDVSGRWCGIVQYMVSVQS